ncbi:hypothetical protein AALK94_15400 [Bacteroides faecichinchillae]|uniref:LA_2272 family surface repeat-containing protein n=1 Tax=Bacteroides faecichinchillae TaxID=871325 RepID=UPI00351139C4
MEIKKAICTAAILMAAVCLQAQNKCAGINLSVWKGISTQSLDSTQTSYVNLGFLSTINRLNGIGINVLGGVTRKEMNGMQISGLANIVGGSMQGLQLSGISNISGNNLAGLSASGLVNITGNGAKGVIISGLTSIGGDNTTGIMMSGFMNVTGETASGLQLSGLANITGEDLSGMMASGLLNVTGKNMDGIQIAGIANITANSLNGMQIGLCNYATQVHGVQLGLINYYQKTIKGFQLGLVNMNPETKVQMLIYGGNTTLGNIGVRFKNKLFYTILGLGTYNLNLNDKISASASYRAGLSLPVTQKLSISGDLGYEHIETFKNKNEVISKRLYALQARINVEYQITEKLGVFATGGYGWTRYYNKSHNFDKKTIVEVGLILF